MNMIWISPDGDDANNGNSHTKPVKTFARVYTLLGGFPESNRICKVMPGTYAERIYPIQPGTSYEGVEESQIISPPPNTSFVFALSDGTHRNLRFKNLEFDGENCISGTIKITYSIGVSEVPHDIVLEGCRIENSVASGILVSGDATRRIGPISLIRCDVFNNGKTDLDHGIYVSSDNVAIVDCHVHENAGWGIHAYNSDTAPVTTGLRVINTLCHDNAAIGPRGVGIGCYRQSGALIRNCQSHSNKDGIVLKDCTGSSIVDCVSNTNEDSGCKIQSCTNCDVTNLVMSGNSASDALIVQSSTIRVWK